MRVIPNLLFTSLLVLATMAARADMQFSSEKADFRLETVADNLAHPWSLAFLPNGDKLVTEREGRLRLIRNGSLLEAPIEGLPELVVAGQGGLLDVLLHPQFERNSTLFLSYAHRTREGMTTRRLSSRLCRAPEQAGTSPGAWNSTATATSTCPWATGGTWTAPRT